VTTDNTVDSGFSSHLQEKWIQVQDSVPYEVFNILNVCTDNIIDGKTVKTLLLRKHKKEHKSEASQK
jgi:hypothetical protein